jgi:hypothetical protein
LPGGLVLAVVEDTHLPFTSNVNCLPTESAGQPLLSGLTGRAESPGPVLPGNKGEFADLSNEIVILAMFGAESATGRVAED